MPFRVPFAIGSGLLSLTLLAGCWATQPPALPDDNSTSALAAPTIAATSSAVPTATPKPVLRSPLTGQPVDKPELVSRRPLLVKIGNSEDERPQSGLAQADVVYESVTEGGITRYAAVFQSQDANAVGPVRSARLSDLQIAPEFGAVLAHVGASAPIMAMLRGNGVLDLDQFFWQPFYHRISQRVAPYNVYTSTEDLRRGAAARGFAADAPQAPYAFEDAVSVGGSDQTVEFDFAPQLHAKYLYDLATHGYHQVEYGNVTSDAASHSAINIANLVVQFVQMKPTGIVEDVNGTHSLDYDLTGSGKVAVFHNGQEFDGSWRRLSPGARTSFQDADGKPITLAVGTTWIALVAPDTALTVHGQTSTAA